MRNKKLPLGTKDEIGSRAELKSQVIQKLFQQFKKRGFNRIKTPILEYVDVFDSLQANDYQAYQMIDTQNRRMVLRPDLTLPIARVMSSTSIETPVKWYYSGDVFRLKNKLSGSYDQLTQAGIEIVGYAGIKAEWECLTIALNGCQQLGIQDLTLELGYSNFIKTALKLLPVPDLTKQAIRNSLAEKNLSRYQQLIEPLLDTEYGAFLKQWPWLFGAFDEAMEVLATLPANEEIQRIQTYLTKLAEFVQINYPDQRITLDLSREAPQQYYTGGIFSLYTKQATNYLCSGGRYDNLLKDFQQQLEPAVGMGFDIDAIVELLNPKPAERPTLIYFAADQWQQAQALLNELPNASLCLADSLAQAKTIAAQRNVTLIDLTDERQVLKNVY
ncbi:ATP phosphoribosyltransferase regulatory subunit [Lactobacillaceae bacterium Scapto_B20]